MTTVRRALRYSWQRQRVDVAFGQRRAGGTSLGRALHPGRGAACAGMGWAAATGPSGPPPALAQTALSCGSPCEAIVKAE